MTKAHSIAGLLLWHWKDIKTSWWKKENSDIWHWQFWFRPQSVTESLESSAETDHHPYPPTITNMCLYTYVFVYTHTHKSWLGFLLGKKNVEFKLKIGVFKFVYWRPWDMSNRMGFHWACWLSRDHWRGNEDELHLSTLSCHPSVGGKRKLNRLNPIRADIINPSTH